MEQIRFDDEMVSVELVADLPFKNDCRAGTPIEWHGKGDIKAYPKRLWPKLAAHPDVWRLAEPRTTSGPVSAKEILDAEVARIKKEREAAAGSNTDLVDTLSTDYTAEQLAELSDDDVRVIAIRRNYGLHPRLNPVNLRTRFLEAQELAKVA